MKYLCDNTGVINGCKKHYTGKSYTFPYVAAYTNLHVCYHTFESILYISTHHKKTVVEHTAPENWRSDDNQLTDSLYRGNLTDFFACCEYYSLNDFSDEQNRLTSYKINVYQMTENKMPLESKHANETSVHAYDESTLRIHRISRIHSYIGTELNFWDATSYETEVFLKKPDSAV